METVQLSLFEFPSETSDKSAIKYLSEAWWDNQIEIALRCLLTILSTAFLVIVTTIETASPQVREFQTRAVTEKRRRKFGTIILRSEMTVKYISWIMKDDQMVYTDTLVDYNPQYANQ